MTVDIQGMNALFSKLDQITDEMRENIAKHIQNSAKSIQNTARSLTPVDTGDLQKSIRVRMDKDALEATIGPRGKEAWRAHFVEFGAVDGPTASPFMTPAFEQERNKYLQGLRDAINNSLK